MTSVGDGPLAGWSAVLVDGVDVGAAHRQRARARLAAARARERKNDEELPQLQVADTPPALPPWTLELLAAPSGAAPLGGALPATPQPAQRPARADASRGGHAERAMESL